MGKMIKRALTYLRSNLKKNLKTMLINTGALIISWTTALFGIAIGYVTSQPIVWGTALAIGIGATSQYVTASVKCIFGEKKEKTE